MKRKKTESLPNELGIDYGEANIGLAIGNNGIVSPLKTINAKNEGVALYEINKVVVENKIGTLIVGVPLSPENKETKESIKIRRFAKILKITTKRPVVFQNEFGSSKIALEEAINQGISKKKRRSNDHLAAALILKSYYNEMK